MLGVKSPTIPPPLPPLSSPLLKTSEPDFFSVRRELDRSFLQSQQIKQQHHEKPATAAPAAPPTNQRQQQEEAAAANAAAAAKAAAAVLAAAGGGVPVPIEFHQHQHQHTHMHHHNHHHQSLTLTTAAAAVAAMAATSSSTAASVTSPSTTAALPIPLTKPSMHALPLIKSPPPPPPSSISLMKPGNLGLLPVTLHSSTVAVPVTKTTTITQSSSPALPGNVTQAVPTQNTLLTTVTQAPGKGIQGTASPISDIPHETTTPIKVTQEKLLPNNIVATLEDTLPSTVTLESNILAVTVTQPCNFANKITPQPVTSCVTNSLPVTSNSQHKSTLPPVLSNNLEAAGMVTKTSNNKNHLTESSRANNDGDIDHDTSMVAMSKASPIPDIALTKSPPAISINGAITEATTPTPTTSASQIVSCDATAAIKLASLTAATSSSSPNVNDTVNDINQQQNQQIAASPSSS